MPSVYSKKSHLLDCQICHYSFMAKRKDRKYCNVCKPGVARKRSKDWYYFNHEENKKRSSENLKQFRRANPEKALLIGAKNRAKSEGVPFNIDLSDVIIPEVCPILKTKFSPRTPYAASLDKIVPNLGYVKGNVQVISRKANVMKNNATLEELKEFANWVRQLPLS